MAGTSLTLLFPLIHGSALVAYRFDLNFTKFQAGKAVGNLGYRCLHLDLHSEQV